ncbi:transcription factor HES-1-like [Astyanax mexicanus]|uniref:transcription factor HES-1-like n=1 Tax=Astyanax mexicanus TaxID=7994 RepID=UPI0020CAB366|nr:transcription factor HES-1-like [Astyanax mexicanus]
MPGHAPQRISACATSKTASSEHRKPSKPIMEKRRRARINRSLVQLKALILHALHADVSRHSKLEKAEILEMTVTHLRSVQRAQAAVSLSVQQRALGRYSAGFSACMTEVTRFMSTCEGVSRELRTHLLAHLARCVTMTPPPQHVLHISQLGDAPPKTRPFFSAPGTSSLCSGNFRPVDRGRPSTLTGPTIPEPSGTGVWRPW